MSDRDRDRGGGGDRPRTGTLFEPSLISTFGGGGGGPAHDAAAAAGFKRASAAAASAPGDRRQDRGIGPGSAPASLPMAKNEAAQSNHGGSSAAKQQQQQQHHGKKTQQQPQHQHHHNQQHHHQHQQQQQYKKGGGGGGGGAAKPPAFVMPTRILAKPTEAAAAGLTANGSSASSNATAPSDGGAASSVVAAASAPAPPAVPVVIKTAAGLPALLYHRPVELFDARGKLVGGDALMSLLSDSAATPSSSSAAAAAPFPCDFTVFGAVGTQFSGRSTILNALARSHSAPRSAASSAASNAPRDPTFMGQDSTRPNGFEIASHEQMLHAASGSSGIQVLVTPERNILVDTPALDAASTLASMFAKEAATGAAPPSSATAVDIAFQLQTLQTLLLLLSSCHVLLVTCESHTLLPMCRLLQRALLLRQHLAADTHFLSTRVVAAAQPGAASNALLSNSNSTSVGSGVSFHGLPDIVFVLNKQPLRELCHPLAGSTLSESTAISRFFREQTFRKNGAVNTFGPPVQPPRSSAAAASGAGAATTEVVNCFQLPFCAETAAGAASSTSQLSLALQELTFQLLTLPKLPASGRASERDWLRHVTRTWQHLQIAPVLAEWRAALQKAAPRPLPIAVPVRTASAHSQRERGAHGQQHKHAGAQQKTASAAAKESAAPATSASSSPAAASSSSSSQPHPRGPKKPQQQQQQQSSRADAALHDRTVHGVQSSRRLYEPPGS